MSKLVEVQTTFGSEEDAVKVGRLLVRERLAACAQVLPRIVSIFEWEGMLRHDDEALLMLKTTEDTWPALRDRLSEIHPYDIPMILALPIEHGNYDYVNWVRENTKG